MGRGRAEIESGGLRKLGGVGKAYLIKFKSTKSHQTSQVLIQEGQDTQPSL